MTLFEILRNILAIYAILVIAFKFLFRNKIKKADSVRIIDGGADGQGEKSFKESEKIKNSWYYKIRKLFL